MCQHKSGIVVKVSETECKVFCLPGEDSHSKIRDAFNISDTALLGRYHTPVEFVPVRGVSAIEDYDFKFDAGKPDWWCQQFEDEAKRVLFAQSQEDVMGSFVGNADFRSLTSAKGLEALASVGGDAYFISTCLGRSGANIGSGGHEQT